MNKLFIVFNAFLLLFIFLSGGIHKILNFQETVNSLETQINTIKMDPIFIIAIIITIIYFYIILNLQIYNKNQKLYLFLLSIISITLIGIPFLVLVKKSLNLQTFTSLIYNITICGVIGLLIFGSLIILYSLYSSMYQNYAYVATMGLATFIAMTILIFHFPTNKKEIISFTKNLSIFGGLMILSQQFVIHI
jgi:heme/copper-type cytochrome/quinol oxidase subunit 4